VARRIGLLMGLVAVAVGAWFVSTWALGLPTGLPGELLGPDATSPTTTSAAVVASPKAPTPKPPSEASGGGYRTEEEWIVSDVTAALAGMAEYARTGKVSTAPVTARSEKTDIVVTRDTGSFTVTVGSLRHAVAISRYLWSPDDFASLAQAMLGPQPAAAAGAAIAPDRPSSILANLTDLRVETLIDENRRLSAELKANMRSAIAHEEAALLVGAFMQRESAGDFSDERSNLSRMTAHLAFARALRGGASQPSIAARVAEALMLNTVSRQRDALQLVTTIETATDVPGAAAWTRALRESITGDWRAARPANPSLLERLVHARARKKRLGENRAHDFIDATADEKERITDWERMLLSSPFTVDAGNQFAPYAVMRESDEMLRVWIAYSTERPNREVLIGHLNDLPTDSPVLMLHGQPEVLVLDWGRWAAFLQRHLIIALWGEFHHAEDQGWKDEAKAVVSKWEPTYGRLRLFPLLRRRVALDAEQYQRAMQDGITLLGEHPEVVNAPMWYRFREQPPKDIKPTQFPELHSWFMPLIPTGTVYQNSFRVLNPMAPSVPQPPILVRWTELAPYDHRTLYQRVWQETDSKPTIADGLRAFAPIYDYDLHAAWWIFDYMKGQQEDYIPIAEHMCELDVDKCQKLAWQLVRVNRDEEAVKVFEKFAAEARDRVAVSLNMEWVVQYLYDAKKYPRANRLAQMAGETGSNGGLLTLARLLERMEHYEEAEEIYRQLQARYDNTFDLGGFCLRQARRTGQKKYVDDARTLLQKVLPQGLETLPADRPSTPPVDGVRLFGVSPRGARLGIREGDIVIGIDDIRVHQADQFKLVMGLNETDFLKFTVWRDNTYQDLSLKVPQRWFGVNLGNYLVKKVEAPAQ
jgi:hypothetical protein